MAGDRRRPGQRPVDDVDRDGFVTVGFMHLAHPCTDRDDLTEATKLMQFTITRTLGLKPRHTEIISGRTVHVPQSHV
jgi:hypothetical protein